MLTRSPGAPPLQGASLPPSPETSCSPASHRSHTLPPLADLSVVPRPRVHSRTSGARPWSLHSALDRLGQTNKQRAFSSVLWLQNTASSEKERYGWAQASHGEDARAGEKNKSNGVVRGDEQRAPQLESRAHQMLSSMGQRTLHFKRSRLTDALHTMTLDFIEGNSAKYLHHPVSVLGGLRCLRVRGFVTVGLILTCLRLKPMHLKLCLQQTAL